MTMMVMAMLMAPVCYLLDCTAFISKLCVYTAQKLHYVSLTAPYISRPIVNILSHFFSLTKHGSATIQTL